jgi:hypothetical protein
MATLGECEPISSQTIAAIYFDRIPVACSGVRHRLLTVDAKKLPAAAKR